LEPTQVRTKQSTPASTECWRMSDPRGCVQFTLDMVFAVHLLRVLTATLRGTSCELQGPCLQPTGNVFPVRCPRGTLRVS
jgi:hypothetical protein